MIKRPDHCPVGDVPCQSLCDALCVPGIVRDRHAAQPQRWRHVKTGGVYEFVAEAMNEADTSVVIVYRNVETGVTWVRAAGEFFDGRFECVDEIRAMGDK